MYPIVKRLVDCTLAFLGLVITLPILVVVALMIKVTSPGPIFYKGTRTGKHGKPFKMYKFRTMVINADKIGGPSTAGGDPRVTPVGTWMRRHKLDELPQLINVLIGDMSLVGPRPEVQVYTDMFTQEEQAILNVRPGITDWASLWNIDEAVILAGSPDPEQAYMEKIRPRKLQLQLAYARHYTFGTDIRILYETIRSVVTGEVVEDSDARFHTYLAMSQ